MNPAYPIAGAASAFYGSADFYGGMGAKRAPAPVVTLSSALAGLPVLLIGLRFFSGAPTPHDLAWSAAAGAVGGLAAALIFRALAIGPVSVASPVLSLTGMCLPVVVGFALGERPTAVALAGLALAAVAIPMLSLAGGAAPGATAAPTAGAVPGSAAAPLPGAAPAPAAASTSAPRRRMGMLPVAFAAGLAAGSFLVCIGRVGQGAGIAPLVVARLVAIALFLAWLTARRMPLWPAAGARGYAIGSGVLDVFANMAYLFAVQHGSLALVAALVSLSPATAVLMARLLIGERWSVPQRWGLALALIAGACISAG